MDKKQFGILASAIRTYYPKEQILPNQQAMELWYRELQDIPYELAEAALRKWVVNNKWSPTIADIRELSTDIGVGTIPDWGDAWESVMTAIRRYGTYNQQEAMDSMDELTQQVVRRLGFRELCMSENIVADRANFRTIYEQLASRHRTDMQMPPQLRATIQQMLGTQQAMLEGGRT